MTRITKAMKEQFKRYRKAYGPMTDEECLEMWDYDNNWCNSDEDAQEWLRNHMLHGEIEEKEIQERFAKKEKSKTAITKAEIKKISAKAKEDRAERLNILEEGLKDYDFLFGPLVEKTNTELKYIDPVTELPITIKSIGFNATCNCRSLTTVYYAGSQAQWNKVRVDSGNYELNHATMIYDYKD